MNNINQFQPISATEAFIGIDVAKAPFSRDKRQVER